MFQYQVMSEQEANQERFQLLKPGIYDAVIKASIDKTSASSGNPMMDISLDVFDSNGIVSNVRDFLVFTKSMMWKVVHFANSAGLLDEYTNQKLCSEVAIGKRVKVKVGLDAGNIIPKEKLNGKPENSRYPDKNKIEDYLEKDNNVTDLTVSNKEITDDDVPF